MGSGWRQAMHKTGVSSFTAWPLPVLLLLPVLLPVPVPVPVPVLLPVPVLRLTVVVVGLGAMVRFCVLILHLLLASFRCFWLCWQLNFRCDGLPLKL